MTAALRDFGSEGRQSDLFAPADTTLTVLSFGAGQDSTAILELYIQDEAGFRARYAPGRSPPRPRSWRSTWARARRKPPLAAPGSKARNERGALSVNKFKSIGQARWQRAS